MSAKEVVIYTDGGCIGNPGLGGYGVVLCYNNHEKQLSGGFRLTTNNRMEIMAAIMGLEALKFPCSVTLYSDSRYLVDAMTNRWVHRWKANGWWRTKKERAINVDLWDKLLTLCDRHTVKFTWLKGHAGHQWHERCDRLSKDAASRENLPVDDGYKRESRTAKQLSLEACIPKTTASPAGQPSTYENQENQRRIGADAKGRRHFPKIGPPQRVQFDGRCYAWAQGSWYDTETFLKPPQSLVHKLNALLMPLLEKEDEQIRSSNELLQRAQQARDSMQYVRAEELTRRAVDLSPDNLGAFAVLSSCLRARGHPEQALDETECVKSGSYPPLLNSRAAALCDLGRWEEAKKVVAHALAIGTDKEESFVVLNRIKAARPELYRKP